MLSCDQVLSELQDYLDEDITPDLKREMEGHLAHCKTCRVIYDTTRKTLTLVTESGVFELPSAVSNKIQNRVMERIRKEPPKS